jgi:hypothetical protein
VSIRPAYIVSILSVWTAYNATFWSTYIHSIFSTNWATVVVATRMANGTTNDATDWATIWTTVE